MEMPHARSSANPCIKNRGTVHAKSFVIDANANPHIFACVTVSSTRIFMLHVMQLGLGEIGKGAIDAMLAQPRHVKLISVVDPVFAGKAMGELMPGRPAIARLKIVGSI